MLQSISNSGANAATTASAKQVIRANASDVLIFGGYLAGGGLGAGIGALYGNAGLGLLAGAVSGAVFGTGGYVLGQWVATPAK